MEWGQGGGREPQSPGVGRATGMPDAWKPPQTAPPPPPLQWSPPCPIVAPPRWVRLRQGLPLMLEMVPVVGGSLGVNMTPR